MNGNFKGMDPELAKVAMNKIKTLKASLESESNAAAGSINEKLVGAFAGSQTGAMQSFVDTINGALRGLYNYLDGKDSNFANKFNEIIASYEVSDENVKQSFSSNLN
jgi:flagellum-specific peptidoglycan hydrolase FlgJ